MRARKLCALAIAAALAGCTENPDPRSPTLKMMETRGVGGWIVATTRTGLVVHGELISATPRYIHVLRIGQWGTTVAPGSALVYLNTADVTEARVYTYESEGGLGPWGLIGGLTTLSHGFFLVFSAPTWIIATSIALSVESGHVELEYPDKPLSELAKWARFPQGIPSTVDEEALLVPRAKRVPKLPPTGPIAPPASVPLEPPGATTPQPVLTNPAEQFQQAKTAAAADDCPRVRELSTAVQRTDRPYWEAVFSKDPAIADCL